MFAERNLDGRGDSLPERDSIFDFLTQLLDGGLRTGEEAAHERVDAKHGAAC
jgi:hypothetical protein